MNRLFFLILGFILTVTGIIYIISYLNLITIGYNFFEYVQFISRHIECLYAPLGIIIILITLIKRR